MILAKEIQEQPHVIANLLETERENVATIATAIREFDPTFVHIAARGTSDNAARYAQYLMGTHWGIPVALAAPSLHTIYKTPPQLGRSLTVGISQSGKAEDVRQVLEDARSQGALTLSITNNADSPLAKEGDYHIPIHAGVEEAIAATKTYTSQLTAVAMLTAALSDDKSLQESLNSLSDHVAQTLTNCEGIADWVQRYRYAQHIIAIGRGYNYATAFEINLKVQELCSTTGSGYSEADFRHGPIAIVNTGYPVIVVAPDGKVFPKVLDLLGKLNELRAETIVISNRQDALELGSKTVSLPADLTEPLSPIAAVIPGQVFGMHLAAEKGLNVDKPEGLSKVTVTL